MQAWAPDISKAGLNLADPGASKPEMLRSALNVIPTGGALRTAPGWHQLGDAIAYANGADGSNETVKLWVRRFDNYGTNRALILGTRQTGTAGTASSVPAGYVVTAGDTFTPAMVGRTIRNTNAASAAFNWKTVITSYVAPTKVAVADDYFAGADTFVIEQGGETVGAAWYGGPGTEPPADKTVLGDMGDIAGFDSFVLNNRLFILAGEDRGRVLHGKTFRFMGMSACQDNNSLTVDVAQAGVHTGKYKFALCFYDAKTYRVSPPLLIEDSTADDGFYTLDEKKIVINTATLPTNTVDEWTHFQLYVRKDTFSDWYLGEEIEKTAGTFEENVADALLLPKTPLVGNRVVPSGFAYGTVWRERGVFWGHHGLAITGGIAAAYGSALVTLGGGYTTAEWMVGARLYMAASGSQPMRGYDIKAVVDSTTLELYGEWDDDDIAAGDGRIVPYPSRVVVGMQGHNHCEFTSPWHYFDVNPDDGDMVVTCFVIGEVLYVLKQRSLWRVLEDSLVDQVGADDVPTVLVQMSEVAQGVGCSGPGAITNDGQGTVYWLDGPRGLVRFNGSRPQRVSVANEADVQPYFEQQDETALWDVRLAHNPIWRCVEIFGLQRPNGDETALRYFEDEGRFFESDVVSGGFPMGGGGASLLSNIEWVEREYAFFTAIASYPADFHHEIWRVDLADGAGGAAEQFVTGEGPKDWTSPYPMVRDMACDRDGHVYAVYQDTYTGTDTDYPISWPDNIWVKRYARDTGAELWASETDVGDYIITYETDAGALQVVLSSSAICCAASATHLAVAIGGDVNDASSNKHAYVWVVLLSLEDGSILSHARFDAAHANIHAENYAIDIVSLHGITWDAENGDFWVASNYVRQNAGAGAVTFPDDFGGRLFRVNEEDVTDTQAVAFVVGADEVAIPLGVSYHPSGKLVCPMWYYKSGDHTADITGQVTSVATDRLIDGGAAFPDWVVGAWVDQTASVPWTGTAEGNVADKLIDATKGQFVEADNADGLWGATILNTTTANTATIIDILDADTLILSDTPTYESGVATHVATDKLKDSTANFPAWVVGCFVYNRVDNTRATVAGKVSGTELTLADAGDGSDIFPDVGDSYVIPDLANIFTNGDGYSISPADRGSVRVASKVSSTELTLEDGAVRYWLGAQGGGETMQTHVFRQIGDSYLIWGNYQASKIGIAVYDIAGAAFTVNTAGSPENQASYAFPFVNNTLIDTAGIGRTGRSIGGYEQQLQEGVSPSADTVDRFSLVWLTDGSNLWKYDMVSETLTAADVAVGTENCMAATRRANGDIVYFHAELSSDHLNTYVTVADKDTGAQDFQIATDFFTDHCGGAGEPDDFPQRLWGFRNGGAIDYSAIVRVTRGDSTGAQPTWVGYWAAFCVGPVWRQAI